MSKKRPRVDRSSTAAPTDSPFNSALAALAGLRSELPAGAPAASAEEQPPAPGDPAPRELPRRVTLQRERKGHGGKTVTRVKGLAADEAAGARWLKELKARLGCGGSLEGQDLILHGDLRQRLAPLLAAEGIPHIAGGR